MKIFLSWSGKRSKAVAELFNAWLPRVIQSVETYISAEDIDKGARWSSDIAGQLLGCSVGIIFLTNENLNAPWIMFEAGALSKTLEKARVCPILLGIENADVTGPLTQFQSTAFTRDDIFRLLKTINTASASDGAKSLDIQDLEATFEVWWPKLETAVKETLAAHPDAVVRKPREQRDMIEEILEGVRGLTQSRAGSSLKIETIPPMPVVHMMEFFTQLVDSLPSSIPLPKQELTYVEYLSEKKPYPWVKADPEVVSKQMDRVREAAEFLLVTLNVHKDWVDKNPSVEIDDEDPLAD